MGVWQVKILKEFYGLVVNQHFGAGNFGITHFRECFFFFLSLAIFFGGPLTRAWQVVFWGRIFDSSFVVLV